MTPTFELAALVQRERTDLAARSRLERVAECARRCCTAPATGLARISQLFRPAPATSCWGGR